MNEEPGKSDQFLREQTINSGQFQNDTDGEIISQRL